MKKILLVAGILTAALLAGCIKDTSFLADTTGASMNGANRLAEEDTSNFVPGEVLIQFKSGTSQTGILNALARISGKVKEHVVTGAMKQAGNNEGFYVVQMPVGVMNALAKINGMTEVAYAEPNYIHKVPEVQQEPDANDPYYSSPEAKEDNLWGMMGMLTYPYQNNYGSRAGEAWWDLQPDGKDKDPYPDRGRTTPLIGSRNVFVALIGEGVASENREFVRPDGSNQIAVGYGLDLLNNDIDPSPEYSSEYVETHVAGTIGAVGNNNFGVAGVNWDVSIIPVRFVNKHNFGTTVNAAKAIDYVISLKENQGLNIVATNNSWQGPNSKIVQEAINRSEQAGILFVVPAGSKNSDNDQIATYPSCYPNDAIISVASITVDGTRSWFSNYGETTVDLAAPGSWIWSTVPLGSDIDPAKDSPIDGIGWVSGTPMAAAHVTGAIALYAAAHNLRPKTKDDALSIKKAIMESARPTQSFQGLTVTGGRLDINSALNKVKNTRLRAD